MKYLLIALLLSSWDSSVRETKTIGYYETRVLCQINADRLNHSYIRHTEFICVIEDKK